MTTYDKAAVTIALFVALAGYLALTALLLSVSQ